MILVVGATGLVGRQICRLLAASGKPTRAMVRATSDQAKVDELKSLGANVVQGDLRDPKSLRAACQGVSAIISTASSMPFTLPAGRKHAGDDGSGRPPEPDRRGLRGGCSADHLYLVPDDDA